MNIIATPSNVNDDHIVSIEGHGIVGRIRPVGKAFRVMDASGRTQITLKSTFQHALNVYKYGV